eukprot:gene10883-10965_t
MRLQVSDLPMMLTHPKELAMTLTEAEAAQALATITETETRTRLLTRYQNGSPYLLLWGAIWLVGFGTSDLAPHMARPVWIALNLIGSAATIWLTMRARRGGPRPARRARQSLALWALATIFAFGTFALLRPRDGGASLAFSGLMVGTIYAGVGVFVGMRWLVTGLALLALTFAGYYVLHAHYALYMAFVCGGGLMLAGLWLRQA